MTINELFINIFFNLHQVIHEWLSIKPNGFKFREGIYRRLKDVMKIFQESWFKGGSTPLLTAPSQLSHQQMTSPALGLRFATPQQVRNCHLLKKKMKKLFIVNWIVWMIIKIISTLLTQQRTPVMASPYHVGNVPSSAAAAAAAWNRASTSMPPPRSTPQQRTPTSSMPPPTEPWARISQPGTPSHATPGASSQMSISPSYSPANKGDATPLLDEWV